MFELDGVDAGNGVARLPLYPSNDSLRGRSNAPICSALVPPRSYSDCAVSCLGFGYAPTSAISPSKPVMVVHPTHTASGIYRARAVGTQIGKGQTRSRLASGYQCSAPTTPVKIGLVACIRWDRKTTPHSRRTGSRVSTRRSPCGCRRCDASHRYRQSASRQDPSW